MTDGKLLSGQQLRPEQTLISVGGQAHLHYQSDGNLVVYLKNNPFWASHTDGYTAGALTMRRDGNLVISDATHPVASTNTQGHPGAMVQLQDDGNFVVYEDPNGPLAGTPIWASSTGIFLVGDVAPEPVPIATECRRPLQGRVRKENKLWRDDTGYRRILGDSAFNILRILKLDPARYYHILDDTVRNLYQMQRNFIYVGGWQGFWSNAEVVPTTLNQWQWGGNVTRPAGPGPTIQAWPDWDDLFAQHCEEFARRKLKLHITAGDGQIFYPGDAGKPAEIEMHRRAARIVKSIDPNVVACWEGQNEIPMNSREAGTENDVKHYGQIIAEVRNILPGVMTGTGAMLSEEPEKLKLGMQYGGEISYVHPGREPFAQCLKRTLGLVYWEGNWRAFPFPYMHGEPKGTNAGPWDGMGDDMYQPSTSLGEMFALHGMAGLIGMADNFFTGAAVKLTDFNSNALGYSEVPPVLEDHLPEDIALWDRETAGAGAILYFTHGKEFRTAMHSSWDSTPPRPVASWTFYGDTITTGTGTPPRGTGFLVGTFQ